MAGTGADAGGAGQADAMAAASADITLEDLPAYEETASTRAPAVNAVVPMIAPQARRAPQEAMPVQQEPLIDLGHDSVTTQSTTNVPSDAPPGYDEAQASSTSQGRE